MENKEIQLTPAEIEMIKVKREKEELEAQMIALKKQAEIEKNIELKKKAIERFKNECKEQRHQAELFKAEFDKIAPGQYFLVKKDHKQNFEGYEYLGDDKKEYYFQELVEEIIYEIQRKGTTERMEVKLHTVYSNDKWNSRVTNKYWALEYGWNKFYKIAKTVHTKIEEKLAVKRREEELKKNTATAKETVLEKLTKKYPGTKIEFREKINSNFIRNGYRNGSYRSWTTNHYVVTFEHGLQIEFQFYEDGRIGEGVINNLHKFDFDSVVDFLSHQTFKENGK